MKEAKEKDQQGKSIHDLKCPKCNDDFNYDTLEAIDSDLANRLSNRAYGRGDNFKQNANFEKMNDIIPQQTGQLLRCDIKHAHSQTDANISIPGVMCDHSYYKGCLKQYLFSHINEFKTLEDILCPVEGCKQFLLKDIITTNFKDFVTKFDEIYCSKKRH